MLSITVPIDEVITHVVQPFTMQYVHSFISELGLEDTFKDNIHILSDNMTSSRSADETNNPTLRCNKLICTYTPNMDPRATKWQASLWRELIGQVNQLGIIGANVPIFLDEVHKLRVIEHDLPTGITMNFRLEFLNRTEAYTAHSRMITRYVYGELFKLTDFQYSYPISTKTVAILRKLSELRGVAPEHFLAWLKTFSADVIQVNRNRDPSSSDGELIVLKNAGQLYGLIDFSADKPQIDTTNQVAALWFLEFSVYCEFDRPNMLTISYPIIINNTPVPEYMVAPEYYRNPVRQMVPTYYPNVNFDNYIKKYCLQQATNPPWASPNYDNFLNVTSFHESRMFKYDPIFSGAFTLDDFDTAEETNLDLFEDYSGFVLPDELKELLLDKMENLFNPGNLLWLGVFADGLRLDRANVRLSRDPDTDHVILHVKNTFKERLYRFVWFYTANPIPLV